MLTADADSSNIVELELKVADTDATELKFWKNMVFPQVLTVQKHGGLVSFISFSYSDKAFFCCLQHHASLAYY